MELIREAEQYLVDNWGEQGITVIQVCHNTPTTPMTNDEFLSHCHACGGDWGAMLLTGIRALYPNVYDAIPQKMGKNAWFCLVYILHLLNIKE
jgi:hypothetical protein